MELDIFETAPQKWFDFGDAEVLIEYSGKEVLTKIGAKAAEIAGKTGRPAGEISNRLLGRKVVKGWRKKSDHNHPGLTVSGQPMDFTPQNLDMFMTKSIEFSNFVNLKCVDSAAFRSAVDVDLDAITDDLFGETAKEEPDDSKNV